MFFVLPHQFFQMRSEARKARERLKARKGRVVKITENERGFYVTAEFDDDN